MRDARHTNKIEFACLLNGNICQSVNAIKYSSTRRYNLQFSKMCSAIVWYCVEQNHLKVFATTKNELQKLKRICINVFRIKFNAKIRKKNMDWRIPMGWAGESICVQTEYAKRPLEPFFDIWFETFAHVLLHANCNCFRHQTFTTYTAWQKKRKPELHWILLRAQSVCAFYKQKQQHVMLQ